MLMVLLLVMLMRMMVLTASDYFSPTLEHMGEGIRVNKDFIGVTLLAFGNGAPDFFSLVVSATQRINLTLAVNSLLGAGVFLCTVVVGVIALLSPGRLHKSILIRDIAFHLTAVVCVSMAFLARAIHLYIGMAFLMVYIAYILLVINYRGLIDAGGALIPNWLFARYEDHHLTRVQSAVLITHVDHRHYQTIVSAASVELDNPTRNIVEAVTQEGAAHGSPQRVLECGDSESETQEPICCETLFSRLGCVLDYPLTGVLDITIPTIESENWHHRYPLLMGQPVVCLIIVTYASGIVSTVNEFALALFLCIIVGSLVGFVLYMWNTVSDSAPTTAAPSPASTAVWLTASFLMSVLWMYMLSGEVLACLSALGTILDLPHGVLGLTILAWGNSLADLTNNTSVARRSLEMALAGCYAGPIFNILVGLGVALMAATLVAFNDVKSGVLTLDISCTISLVFLYTVLVSTLVVVTCSPDFELRPWHGMVLLSVYAVYLMCQVLFLLH